MLLILTILAYVTDASFNLFYSKFYSIKVVVIAAIIIIITTATTTITIVAVITNTINTDIILLIIAVSIGNKLIIDSIDALKNTVYITFIMSYNIYDK